MPDIFISRTLFASRLERNSYQNFIASVDPVTIPMPNPWILQDSKNEVLYRSSSKVYTGMLKPVFDAVVTRGAAARMASQFSNLRFLDHVLLHFIDIRILH